MKLMEQSSRIRGDQDKYRNKDRLRRDPCLDSIKEELRRVFEEYYSDKIEYAVVYSSIARYGCGRDVDLALKFKKR